jgi:hypothetical protein
VNEPNPNRLNEPTQKPRERAKPKTGRTPGSPHSKQKTRPIPECPLDSRLNKPESTPLSRFEKE